MDTWAVMPTLEEQKVSNVAQLVRWGISEKKAKEKTELHVFLNQQQTLYAIIITNTR
jgi:hypothetical protein